MGDMADAFSLCLIDLTCSLLCRAQCQSRHHLSRSQAAAHLQGVWEEGCAAPGGHAPPGAAEQHALHRAGKVHQGAGQAGHPVPVPCRLPEVTHCVPAVGGCVQAGAGVLTACQGAA